MNKKIFTILVLLVSLHIEKLPVKADSISPSITSKGQVYSQEAPDTSFYGIGMSGRLTEASMLRFDVERTLHDGKIDEAVRKAKKAVQLDPADPTSHVLLARALTAKFYAIKGPVDEKLLAECLSEWNLIWHHDADQLEQGEARIEARKLMKIAKAIAKEKAIALAKEQESRKEAKEALVATRKKRWFFF